MFCEECGKSNPAGVEFCVRCGAPLIDYSDLYAGETQELGCDPDSDAAREEQTYRYGMPSSAAGGAPSPEKRNGRKGLIGGIVAAAAAVVVILVLLFTVGPLSGTDESASAADTVQETAEQEITEDAETDSEEDAETAETDETDTEGLTDEYAPIITYSDADYVESLDDLSDAQMEFLKGEAEDYFLHDGTIEGGYWCSSAVEDWAACASLESMEYLGAYLMEWSYSGEDEIWHSVYLVYRMEIHTCFADFDEHTTVYWCAEICNPSIDEGRVSYDFIAFPYVYEGGRVDVDTGYFYGNSSVKMRMSRPKQVMIPAIWLLWIACGLYLTGSRRLRRMVT